MHPRQHHPPPSYARAPSGAPRLFGAADLPLPLLARVGSLQDRLRARPALAEMLNEQARQAGAVVSAGPDGRLIVPGRRDSSPVAYGFPASDDDVDYCLEDTPGLSAASFVTLKTSLEQHLGAIRQSATEGVAEMEMVLAEQVSFRVVSVLEVERRLRYLVSRFCKARKHVLHKYRGYVRNRRWIENVATRQRRGCLSHRQNNILRLWLFTNFSNPYPDAPDKRRLILETQLTMTQINNWLINARSRVWKPTVENMSGERIRKEMTSREDRYIEPRQGEFRTEFDSDYFAAPPPPPSLHNGTIVHTDAVVNSGQHLSSPALPAAAAVPSQQQSGNPPAGVGSTGAATHVDALPEDGTWLAQPQWNGLDFGADDGLPH